MRIRSLNHCIYQLQYHIVWGTKYRRKFIVPNVKKDLITCFYDTVKKYPTLHIFAVNTNKDHVHIQLEASPNVALSAIVQKLKITSSIYLQKRFKFIREMYLRKEGIWSVGYFVSSVGLNEEQIHKYIDRQSKVEVPHTIKTLQIRKKQRRFEFS